MTSKEHLRSTIGLNDDYLSDISEEIDTANSKSSYNNKTTYYSKYQPLSSKSIPISRSNFPGFKELCTYSFKFYCQAIPLAANRINPYLLNLVSLYFLSWFHSTTITAGFGLTTSQYTFFWGVITQVNGETLGIICSKEFGRQGWKTMRITFYRSLLWNMIITAFAFQLYARIDQIQIKIGFEENLSYTTHRMIVSMIPSLFVQTINEVIRNYLASMKITEPFVYINITTFCIFPIGAYYFIWYLEWELIGFGILKYIIEMVGMIGQIIASKRLSPPEALIMESFKEIFDLKELWKYIKQFSKIILGWYSYYIGQEVIMVMLGLTHENDLMASWVACFNVMTMVWVVGSGISNQVRTEVGTNIYIDIFKAKKHAYMGLVLAAIYGLIVGIQISIFYMQIAWTMSRVENVLKHLRFMVLYSGPLCIFMGVIPTINTVLRIIEKENFLSWVSAFCQIVLFNGVSAICLFWFNQDGSYVIQYWFGTSIVFGVLTIYVIVKFDWDQIGPYELREPLDNSEFDIIL